MQVSSELSLNVLQHILSNYGLTVDGFIPLSHTSANSNVLLETNRGKVILSIFEEQSPEEVSRIAKLLSWLAEHQFYTSQLLLTSQGNLTIDYNKKTAFLKDYIPGKVCFSLSDDMLQQVGSTMGKLHEIPTTEYLPRTNYYDSSTFNVFGLGIDTEYERWLEERTIVLENKLPKDIPSGLIHGDIFADNVLFENNKLTAIIDFELAFHYYKAFDLGMAIIGLCTEKNKVVLTKARALVRGYQQIRKLENKEKKSLQGFTELAAVKTSNWRFWRFRCYEDNPEMLDKYEEMRQLAMSVQIIPTKTFTSTIFVTDQFENMVH